MKTTIVYGIFIAWIFMGCDSNKPFRIAENNSPSYAANTAFQSFEDLASPKVAALKNKYQTDTIFRGEQDEFKRILLLRNWISTTIKISDFEDHYPGGDYADSILAAALKGQGYHCGHYMIVQNALMNSYGYITRCFGAGPGVKGGPDGHHGSNEIWSNSYEKWFLSDAKYNHHFEKNGIPLSALEVRAEYLKNGAADIVLAKGPQRTVITLDSLKNQQGGFKKRDTKDFASTYTWIAWEKINNRFTEWPQNRHDVNYLNMYADEYFKNNTWIRDGNPYWAYGTKFLNEVQDQKAIEWTPNTVVINATVDNHTARIQLKSNTPNFKTYEVKRAPGSDWENTSDSLTISLNQEKELLAFRAVNLAGVAGPESSVRFEK